MDEADAESKGRHNYGDKREYGDNGNPKLADPITVAHGEGQHCTTHKHRDVEREEHLGIRV